MELIWTPWRYHYIGSAKPEACVFCTLQKLAGCRGAHPFRGEKNFVVLNAFPYTTGHLMIVPYQHIGDLQECEPETLAEMMRLAQRMQIGAGRRLPSGWL